MFLTVIDVTKYQDPLHVLMRYIAEVSSNLICHACAYLLLTMAMQKEPDCDMVLVHDVDLECIDALDGVVCLSIYQSIVPSHVFSRRLSLSGSTNSWLTFEILGHRHTTQVVRIRHIFAGSRSYNMCKR